MTKIDKQICPTCLGKGSVFRKLPRYSDKDRAKARELYRQGLTFRKIAERLGIDHPQKVKSMIEAKL